MKKFIITGIISLFLIGCGSTSIEKSWQAPGASVTTNNTQDKTFVIALVKDETMIQIGTEMA